MTATPEHLARVAGPVEARLDDYLAEHEQEWAAIDPALGGAFASLRNLVLAPAKRLRAAFCHWGYVIGAGPPLSDQVIDAGAALELLQAFALMHDDVMDRSSLRRGEPAVHLQHRRHHEASRWFGDATHYGESAAVLIGNLAHVFADDLLLRAAGAEPTVWRQWNQLRVEVNLGQFLDLNGAAQRTREPDAAMRILHYKSATYTIERPLLIDAALAGELDRLHDPLHAFGEPLGHAFQLRDDVLGAVGDPAITGKPVGDDLREGKPTPLLAEAHQAATPAQRELLDRVGRDQLSDAAVMELVEVLHHTGAITMIENRIEALVRQSLDALDHIGGETELSALRDLARYVTNRTR